MTCRLSVQLILNPERNYYSIHRNLHGRDIIDLLTLSASLLQRWLSDNLSRNNSNEISGDYNYHVITAIKSIAYTRDTARDQ
jgi:hypothetical protein